MKPASPKEREWAFIPELREPESIFFHWSRQTPRKSEADLRGGIRLDWQVLDPQGLLETVKADLLRSLKTAGLSVTGLYPVRVKLRKVLGHEAFRLRVSGGCCEIEGGTIEGIRRAIYCFEEQLRGADGPFLPLGEIERKPVVATRISRCFFGPIKRPPKNRDELADDQNYYPDEYLSRLAREGVNGLWLTASFRDLCPSRFFPGFGEDAQQRIRKLRETVERCARYGIGIYVFCMEPQGFGEVPFLHSPEYLKGHPELGGHREGPYTFFCTSTRTGLEYLEEATEFLFSQVPGLAGLINISMGETPTHCYSNLLYDTRPNTCPRCSRREPWEVFRDTLSAMKKGMGKANPEAKLICWLYVPGVIEQPDRPFSVFREQIARIAAGIPPGVTLQYNFESMGETRQLGSKRLIQDYSLAYVGPSGIFEDCAREAIAAGGEMSAKLQVGCSHEVATVPWVPAPGNLFRKYQAMHRLGVSSAMQCWYFGNYPSLMTRAAGRLSFAPLPRSEDDFLLELAKPEWGPDAPHVAKAWKHFSAAYREFPANLHFAWYGPVHDSVAWPLHLKPVCRGIAPSWRFDYPPSGDRIGECIGYQHQWNEILILGERMATRWRQGLEALKMISPVQRGRRKLALELGVAKAMGIQLDSAFHVIQFYSQRELLFLFPPQEHRQRLRLLGELRKLVRLEIANSRRLARLATQDSRLGFHSEVEGHKYFPALLLWRVEQLRRLLRQEFPEVERKIRLRQWLFPAYTGLRKVGKKYRYPVFWNPLSRPSLQEGGGLWEECPLVDGNGDSKALQWETAWRARQEGNLLVFEVKSGVPPEVIKQIEERDVLSGDHVAILIEPHRLWPAREFIVGVSGVRYDSTGPLPGELAWISEVERLASGWHLHVQIPLKLLGNMGYALRVNVIRKTPDGRTFAWVPPAPLKRRLIMKDRNPRAFGWLIPK